jgi:drug/metabolite transporter (DMT)-like permease
MALSALGFSAMSVLVKLACRTLPTGEVVLARAAITLVLSFVMVRRAGLSSLGTQRGKLVQRGLLGFAALSCYYLSLARLPLADATTLQNMIPVFTALLAWWILGERVGRGAAIAIGCGVAGVVLVAHPTGDADVLGVTCALVGAMFSAIAYVTVRQLARTEHPLVIVLYFPLVATPLAIPWAAYHWVWPDATGWLTLLAIGAATQMGQVFMTMGLAVERAARATSVGYLQICFAIVWQLVVFDVSPSWTTLAGAALIISGTLVVSATAGSAAPPHMPTSPAP